MGLISKITNPDRLSNKNLILLFSSLGYMQSAGLTHRDAIEIIMNTPDTKIPKKALQKMYDAFGDGLKLSDVLHKYEKIVGPMYWRQVEAAELTGKVPECLERIVNQLKSNAGVIQRIKGAMTYPIIVLVIALIAGYYLLTTAIPEMGEMMMEFNADLPAMTKALIRLCELLTTRGIFVLMFLALIVIGIIWALKKPLRVKWHKFITSFFLSKNISINLNYSIVYTLINDMIANGSEASEALRVAAASTANVYISNQLVSCAGVMESEGSSMTQALQDAKTMPSEDRMMLDVGSRTGREMEILCDMAVRRRDEANAAVDRFIDMINPLTMIFVAGIVGVLVISIYLPMLTMASSMQM